jgi:hypothetical protein
VVMMEEADVLTVQKEACKMRALRSIEFHNKEHMHLTIQTVMAAPTVPPSPVNLLAKIAFKPAT